MRKIIFAASLISVLYYSLLDTAYLQASPNDELIFLNWSEYIDPDIVAEFEHQHNVKINQVFYESDDTRTEILLQTNGQGFDLVLSSGVALKTYYKQGWLAPIVPEQVPNIKHINKRWLQAFPYADGYAVPYLWGTTGIAYRKDLLGYDITSWQQIFKPDKKLQGKILMPKTVNELVGMALKALGYSLNSSSSEENQQAENLLQEQKKHVREYGYITLNEKSALVTGEIYAVITYSGDALVVKDLEPNIEYVVPVEGGNIWVDYLTVLESSTNKQLAYKFIDFLNQPDIAARLAEFSVCASPNKAAEKLLDKEFLTNPIIYPDKKALEKSEFYEILPAKTQRIRNSIFSNITQ